MGTLNRALRSSPNILKNSIYKIIPFGHRYGKNFKKKLEELIENESLPLSDLKIIQKVNLTLTLIDAFYFVPYYKKIFNDISVRSDDINNDPFNVLEKMPYLTKDIIKRNFNDLQTIKKEEKFTTIHTSGSTGSPMKINIPKSLFEIEAAYQERSWRSHGPSLFFNKSVWIKRWIPSPGEPIYNEDKERRWLMLSPYHISQETIEQYVDLINGYKAPCLVGYPSSIYILALNMKKKNLKFKNIKSIHVASESILPEWREKTLEITGIPMKTHYGMMEKSSFFHQCSNTDFYHENLEYGFTDILDNGEVVITGFINKVQPFIKYKIGDIAIKNEGNQKCLCGSNLPLTVKDFIGRSDDILESPDGRMFPPVNFYTFFHKINGVEFFRVSQVEKDYVLVEIVASSDTKKIENMVRKELDKRFLDSFKYEINFVDEIIRSTDSGKIHCVRNLTRRQI
jgi:phenylacetate-CoA ligase